MTREYWMLALRASLHHAAVDATYGASGAVPTVPIGPGPVRWLVDRLVSAEAALGHPPRAQARRCSQQHQPGPAHGGRQPQHAVPRGREIENWQFTLDRLPHEPELTKKLAEIDLYKAGHHGSRNATPRSLHALWVDRPDTLPRMTVLMSTRSGVHGSTEATAVPRATLVTALEQVASLVSTDDLDQGEPFVEVVANTTGGPFARVPQPG